MENKQQYLRGDVYFADLEPHTGSEQGGQRPVVILQNNLGNRFSPTVIVATLTSKIDKKRCQPTHVLLEGGNALDRPSIVQLEQVFTLDKQKLLHYMGSLSSDEMARINAAGIISMALDDTTVRVDDDT